MSLSHLPILSFPFYLFSPFSLLHSLSLSLSVLSLLSFFPSLTSLPSYPFSLSIHSPPSSLPLLSSTFSYLPSLTFFSLLSPPHSFLSFQLSLSPILSVLSHLSLLYIFLLSHSSPFSSLPFSSLFYPLSLSLSTSFCVSSSFSFLSLSPLSNFSPFSLLSSPLFTVFCLSPFRSLSSQVGQISREGGRRAGKCGGREAGG